MTDAFLAFATAYRSDLAFVAGFFIVALTFIFLVRINGRRRRSQDRIEHAKLRSQEVAEKNKSAARKVSPQAPQKKIERKTPLPGAGVKRCSLCHENEGNEKLTTSNDTSICRRCLSICGILEPSRRVYSERIRELSVTLRKASAGDASRSELKRRIDVLAGLLRRQEREKKNDIVGNVQLLEIINSGSFATVWRARETSARVGSNKAVAIKIFHQDKLTQDVMFWRFGRGIRAMKHLAAFGDKLPRSIVRFHEESGDWLSFTMEFIEGGDIQNLSDKEHDLEARLKIFQSVAEATQFAHANGIIHRDIKPGNVLLRGDGTAALTDFDISALEFTNSDSVQGRGLGTPMFGAPEQLMGDFEQSAPSADVYSLGKLLYYLVKLQLPPHGSTEHGITPEYLQQLPERWAASIQLAMQRVPANRPQSVVDFLKICGLH